MRNVIRWRALYPIGLLAAIFIIVPLLFGDRLARGAVEKGGTHVVGAKVDLNSARINYGDGSLALKGLQVTNPGRPMTNMVEVDDIQIDIRVLPLLEKKVVFDTVRLHGMRFNTPRTTSGAVARPSATAVAARRMVDDWLGQVKVPPLDLSSLSKSVNVEGISPDSLATLREARHAIAYVDTAHARLTNDIRALDPRPTIDSAEALLNRLRGANLRTLGIGGARQAVSDVRRTISEIGEIDDRLRAFDSDLRDNLGGMGARIAAVPAAREQDYAYARSLLSLPTFDVPSIGPQLFGDVVATQIGELLYWVELAEEYMPPGIERQLKAGPSRVRASGVNVVFPREEILPDFLLRIAELSMSVAGGGVAAGEYNATVAGLTTQPAVYGAPTTFSVSRDGSTGGVGAISIAGLLDHRAVPLRDSVLARASGVNLPTVGLGGIGGDAVLGSGTTQLSFSRTGGSINGVWSWRAPAVRWERDSSVSLASSGEMRFVEDALWRAVSRLSEVEIEATFEGNIKAPRLGIRTNVASAVANALRDQLGEEIENAERQVRAKIDELVGEQVQRVRSAEAELRGEFTNRVNQERQQLDEKRKELEDRLRELVRIPGIG